MIYFGKRPKLGKGYDVGTLRTTERKWDDGNQLHENKWLVSSHLAKFSAQSLQPLLLSSTSYLSLSKFFVCVASKLQAREAYEEDREHDECIQLRSEGQELHRLQV